MLHRLFFGNPQVNLLFIVRIIVGLWMLWYGKDVFIEEWFEIRKVSWGEGGYGFSNPVLMLYLSKISEIIFGLFLALGLLTRFSSFALLIIMTVAISVGQNWNIFPYDKGEITFFYWLFCLVFLLIGGGKYSLDYLFFKRKKNPYLY